MTQADEGQVVIDPRGVHRWTVLWLHGLGADGHDFEPIVGELGLGREHGIRFVFPHAPVRPVTVNGAMPMRAWYDIASPRIDAQEDAAGIRAAQADLDARIAAEAEPVGAGRIILAGFSQGGALALHAGLRHANRLGGIVVLSGYLPLADTLADELSGANRETPVFQAHGVHDPIVPIALGRQARDAVAGLRPAPAWHEYPMQHAVCAEEIAALGAWLREVTGSG